MIYDIALLVICAGFYYSGFLLWHAREEFSLAAPLAVACAVFSFLAFLAVVDWFLLAASLFFLFTLIMLS